MGTCYKTVNILRNKNEKEKNKNKNKNQTGKK